MDSTFLGAWNAKTGWPLINADGRGCKHKEIGVYPRSSAAN
jgi:hypothetical protein